MKKGLIIGHVSGTVKIVPSTGSPRNAKAGDTLKTGERLKLGPSGACSLVDEKRRLVARIAKPPAGGKALEVKTWHPPCRTVKKLEDEFVFVAATRNIKKSLVARVLRAAA